MKLLLAAPFPYRLSTPLGLGYLAVALRRAGHDVAIRNPVTGRDDPAEFARWCAEQRFDAVGLQVMTSERSATQALLGALRARLPTALRLLGGPHVTGVGASILAEFPDADFAFCGEAELGLPELLARLGKREQVRPRKKLSDVPGLVFRQNGELRANPPEHVQDIDSLGPLPWELFDLQGYNEQPSVQHDGYPWYWVATSRGCPYRCTYCMGHMLGGGLRLHSARYVVDELQALARLGAPAFTLADDTPTANKQHFLDFCTELESRRLGLPWDIAGNGTRFETLDSDLLHGMETAGCRRVAVALESGSARMLERFNRSYRPEEAIRRINALAEMTPMGFEVFFLIGHPDETDADILATLRALLALKVDRVSVNLFSPWPGTAVTEQLRREGRLPELPDEAYLYGSAALPTRSIPLARLRRYHALLNAAFYSRPDKALKLIRQLGPGIVVRSAGRLLSAALGRGPAGISNPRRR